MKKIIKKISEKRGSELAQTVLITSIMVVIIVTLFFPQIKSLLSSSMSKMTSWFDTVLNTL